MTFVKNKKVFLNVVIIVLTIYTILYLFFPFGIEIFFLIPLSIILLYLFITNFPLLTKQIQFKDDTLLAWEYVKEYWYKFRKENLSTLNAKVMTAYFGDSENDKYIAFSVRRGAGGMKPGFPLVIIVKASKPFQVVAWDDKPTEEIENEPFLLLSKYFVGTPTPRPRVESSLLPLRKTIEKEERKKEREEEEELKEFKEFPTESLVE